MLRRISSFLGLFAGLVIFATGCGTFEVRVDSTPTPDHSAVGTLVSLMLTGTQYAQTATQQAALITPLPPVGIVEGRVCYPSENIPAMTIYFKVVATEKLITLESQEQQDTYSINIPAGRYIAYAWVPEYQVGGIYSHAVECGLSESCTDHSPYQFEIAPGQILNGIDICDWVFPASDLPHPTGTHLPGSKTIGD